MSIFKASKVVPAAVADLSTVAQALAEHFSALDYEVTSEQADPQCWEIGIHKGGTFQAIIGMKTALRIRIQSVEGGTQIEAGIGFLESPVLVTQTWGLVRQSKLDEEAIAVAEAALLAQAHAGAARYCHECGAAITRAAAFCHACGARLTL